MPDINTEALLNNFAVRCFRDVADHDYISARLAYRAGLFQQFHWSSLQAVEKYLKAILLFNRIKAKNLKHDLDKALQKTTELPFEFKISDVSREFIKHIDQFGRFRYLEISYYLYGPKLLELDHTVWDIRRYCKTLNYDLILSDGRTKNMLEMELKGIEKSREHKPKNFPIPAGALERIIENKNHPARSALIWQNLYFSKRSRKNVRMSEHMHATNSPFYLHPEMLYEVEKYVLIPGDVIKAYEEMITENKKGATRAP